LEKIAVNNIASVGIIARASNPGEIFIERKDNGHPLKLVHGTLCTIGGNWVGPAAKDDTGPLATFRREIGEELKLKKEVKSTAELGLLGLEDAASKDYQVSVNDVSVTDEDEADLADVKAAIIENCSPFGSRVLTITREAILAADPESKRDGFSALSCYWEVLLPEDIWAKLVRLQEKFGNISDESVSLITSVDEIVERGDRGAFAHEHALQKFFLDKGLAKANDMVITAHQSSVDAGPILDSYAECLEKYDVAKHP
jgi:hypothetical protein